MGNIYFRKEAEEWNQAFPSGNGFLGAMVFGNVAKERLKLMMNADHQKLDDATMELIRQEIGCVITKYVVIEPENIEIKVMLKDYKKRE